MISDMILRLLTEASVRAALVLVLALAVASSLRRASAELRHAVWKAGVLAVLLLPLGLFLMPRWKLEILPAAAARGAATPAASNLAAAPAESTALNGWIEPLPLPHARVPWATAITLAWLTGLALFAVREVRCRLRLARLLREAEPTTDPAIARAVAEAAARADYRAPFQCRVSRELRVPLACGVSRPTVLLPERAREWGASVLSDVLVHEMSHLRRRDPLWLWAARIGRALYWFHPLVWLATRRMLAESERACDDAVMRGGERPSGYAETLLFVASPAGTPEPAPALAFVRRRGLERRIAEVLAQGRNLRPLGVWSRGLLAVLAIGIGGTAAVAHPVPTCAGTHEASAAVTPAPPAEDAPDFHAGGPARVRSAYVCNENKSAAHLEDATVEVALSADGAEARLSRPKIAFENRDRQRAIAAIQLGLELPTTQDRMWEDVQVAPGGTAELQLVPREWSAVVPASDASRLLVQVTGLRFANGDTWQGKDMVSFPDGKTPKPPRAKASAKESAPTPAPEASVSEGRAIEVTAEFPNETSIPARFRNPAGAPVEIVDARTPLRRPGAGERRALTDLPAIRIANHTGKDVAQLRVRYKADGESHAVSGYTVRIPANGSIVLQRRDYEMWGRAKEMTVQLLGARFDDGSVWGTMDSRIDARDAWVYPLEP